MGKATITIYSDDTYITKTEVESNGLEDSGIIAGGLAALLDMMSRITEKKTNEAAEDLKFIIDKLVEELINDNPD